MAWTLIPAAKSLFNEFNTLAPKRDHASDGAVGDLRHQERVSDHNPDETGNTGSAHDRDSINEVHAIDVDKDLRQPGQTMEGCVQKILARCRSRHEKRLRYIIFNRRIWSKSNGWKQSSYSGANPHDKHAHFSFEYGSGSTLANPENVTSAWGLLPGSTSPPVGGDDDVTPADIIAISKAVWAYKLTDPYDKNAPQRQLPAGVWLSYTADQGRQNTGLIMLKSLIESAKTAAESQQEIQAKLDEALAILTELQEPEAAEPPAEEPQDVT